jgi:hypothetical protein
LERVSSANPCNCLALWLRNRPLGLDTSQEELNRTAEINIFRPASAGFFLSALAPLAD